MRINRDIIEPVDLDQFNVLVRFIEEFWLSIVKLPGGEA